MRVMKRLCASLAIAFATYSRIPMPQVDWSEENRRYSLCFFPLIGVVIALAIWAWLHLCKVLSLSGMLQGTIGAAIPLIITGGIHMDGFMDVTDAVSSWQTKERRLEILKDSHVGAFAVMGCGAYLLVMAGLLSEATLSDAPMLGACYVVSRALSAATSVWMKGAKQDGMLHSFSHIARRRAVTLSAAGYGCACLAIWAVCGGWLAAILAVALIGCGLYYRRMAYRLFGGVTGDLAGWLLQVTELALIAMVIIGGKLV